MYEVIMSQDAQEYLAGMQDNHRRKSVAILTRLSAEGPMLHRPHADHVRGKIKELRCGISTFEHRFMFFFHGKKIIVTHGFLKKENAIRESEIARAERFYRDYMGAAG